MKKLAALVVVGLALALALAGSAEAQCGVGCLNQKVAKLSRGLAKDQKTIALLSTTVAAQEQKITGQAQTISNQGNTIAGQNKALSTQGEELEGLFECLYEFPMTQYGEAAGTEGYEYNTGTATVNTTGLDVPEEGEEVDVWPIFDACNTTEVLSSAISSAGGTSGASSALFPTRTVFP